MTRNGPPQQLQKIEIGEAQIIWFQSGFLTNTTGHDLITLAKGENLSFGKNLKKN